MFIYYDNEVLLLQTKVYKELANQKRLKFIAEAQLKIQEVLNIQQTVIRFRLQKTVFRVYYI